MPYSVFHIRFGQVPLSVVVDEVDYVRETTRVSARYPAEPAVASDSEPREPVMAP
ncbi:hypothetical protein ABZ608_33585 [Streptomyces sp. NPDC013172]|uniref:hypothetical protein n=1 Tax=Streptomyces sp. NPDC013172 TaxID=3155009 RepID=UPI0033FA11A5